MSAVAILAALLLTVVYSWTFYNLPVLVVGIRNHCREKRRPCKKDVIPDEELPFFSVVVPAKNEEVVLPRLLSALLHQSYPEEKVEVIVVEDGSTDATVGICKEYVERSRGRVCVIHSEDSNGKPSALNRALKACRGGIIAVFDADNIPEHDALRNAAKYFQDESIVALQGRALTVNSDVNMLTKFVSYEEAMWYEGYLKGKDALNLFVHLKGSCQFIRRNALESLGGWSEKHLSEDIEISARLTDEGHRIKYASDVRSWQESPETLTQMLRQRIRWYRGTMQVAFSYGRLIRKPSFKTLDAELALIGPLVLIISLIGYTLSLLIFCSSGGSITPIINSIGWIATTITNIVGALCLMYVAEPKSREDLLWFPFIYAYWSFQVVLASWALIRIVLRRQDEWNKTLKTGSVTVDDLVLFRKWEAQSPD